MSKQSLHIRNGRVIDPSRQIDAVGDVFVENGLLVPALTRKADEIIDATGLLVAPGLIDMHVHFREPGQTHKETIASGARAAAAGGFTSVAVMPNTQPATDSPSTITLIREKAAQTACVNVFVTGAITKGLQGEELAPIGSMARAGIVAITDDGHCIQNHEIMRRALEYAKMFSLPLLDHCQDYSLVGDGVMHEGDWSLRLGLPGWPRIGEEIIVNRNIMLAELLDTPVHCQHITSGGSIGLIREARRRGVKISGEVCPHHVWFTDASLAGYDSNFKMNPPLREERDVELILEGIADGTIDILCSDHAPHATYEKEVELDQAPFGILGLETEFSAFADLLVHRRKLLDWSGLIARYTINPARLLRLDRGTLAEGKPGDITLIDPDLEWTYDVHESCSLSRNTPYHGVSFRGRAVRTLVAGHTVWKP